MKRNDFAVEVIAADQGTMRAFTWVARLALIVVLALPVLSPRAADAATYAVGPGKTYTQLSQVVNLVNPGDVVTVDGGSSYSGGARFTRAGTSSAPITIRGVRANGARPIVSGSANAIELAADYYVLEGFEISNGSSRCVYVHGHGITIRDSFIHNCPTHGIASADTDSGSLTVEYVEVTNSGEGSQSHPLYIESDEVKHPGSVFRLQYSYIHDNPGGHAVKSRHERNEIYYNWIDATALYRALELIGAETGISGQTPGLRREDSDVVGNVLRQPGDFPLVRLGGDKDDADTSGRYRFVNNTMITASPDGVFQLFLTLESLEMSNNVIYRTNGNARIIDDDDVIWAGGRAIGGSNNWVQTGATEVPSELVGTIKGSSPGFANVGSLDFRVAAGSPLINSGVSPTPTLSGHAFPSPLALPIMQPPVHAIEAVGGAAGRPTVGAIDIGAYEYNSSVTTPAPPTGLTAN